MAGGEQAKGGGGGGGCPFFPRLRRAGGRCRRLVLYCRWRRAEARGGVCRCVSQLARPPPPRCDGEVALSACVAVPVARGISPCESTRGFKPRTRCFSESPLHWKRATPGAPSRISHRVQTSNVWRRRDVPSSDEVYLAGLDTRPGRKFVVELQLVAGRLLLKV
jgi:hypothetical protein